MFSIEQDFSSDELDALINQDVDDFIDDHVEHLRLIGKDFTERARSKVAAGEKIYQNRTWNLVSSIGFCLANQGEIVESYFPSVKGGTTGQEVGKELAERLAIYGNGSEGIRLVLVAGEKYSEYLQDKGYDVLDNSYLITEDELDRLLA